MLAGGPALAPYPGYGPGRCHLMHQVYGPPGAFAGPAGCGPQVYGPPGAFAPAPPAQAPSKWPQALDAFYEKMRAPPSWPAREVHELSGAAQVLAATIPATGMLRLEPRPAAPGLARAGSAVPATPAIPAAPVAPAAQPALALALAALVGSASPASPTPATPATPAAGARAEAKVPCRPTAAQRPPRPQRAFCRRLTEEDLAQAVRLAGFGCRELGEQIAAEFHGRRERHWPGLQGYLDVAEATAALRQVPYSRLHD